MEEVALDDAVAAEASWWTPGRRVAVILPLASANMAVYLALNWHPLRAVRELPMTVIDRALPLLPWTVWPYAVLLLADLVLPLTMRRDETFVRMIRCYGVTVLLNIVGWAALPIAYPRPPVPAGAGISMWGYRTLVGIDTPLNCFPSGHISIPAVLCWALTTEQPRLRKPVWIGFAVLAPSILTTKQHYAWDLVGGLAIAWMGTLAVRRWERFEAA